MYAGWPEILPPVTLASTSLPTCVFPLITLHWLTTPLLTEQPERLPTLEPPTNTSAWNLLATALPLSILAPLKVHARSDASVRRSPENFHPETTASVSRVLLRPRMTR